MTLFASLYAGGALVSSLGYLALNRRYARVGDESVTRQALGALLCGALWPFWLGVALYSHKKWREFSK